jgi:hypothetical protein
MSSMSFRGRAFQHQVTALGQAVPAQTPVQAQPQQSNAGWSLLKYGVAALAGYWIGKKLDVPKKLDKPKKKLDATKLDVTLDEYVLAFEHELAKKLAKEKGVNLLHTVRGTELRRGMHLAVLTADHDSLDPVAILGVTYKDSKGKLHTVDSVTEAMQECGVKTLSGLEKCDARLLASMPSLGLDTVDIYLYHGGWVCCSGANNQIFYLTDDWTKLLSA